MSALQQRIAAITENVNEFLFLRYSLKTWRGMNLIILLQTRRTQPYAEAVSMPQGADQDQPYA